ncbi:MAG TPA: SDR family oxidoreductase [Propylenella sp.]|nr:SDR family oxidoreductase [Propylenella sp.]
MARTILITGCSSGIGQCAARGMKARGWRVFATARKPEDIAALKANGFDVLYLDYAEADSIRAAAETTLKATGGTLDALFNNGAYAQPGALEDVRTDVLRAQFEANFFGWHELTRLVVPPMRRQGHGRIVMNSSILGLIALGFRGPYNCTKFAVEAYSDTLRIELAGSGIHVSVIEPGPIRTRFTKTAVEHARKNIDLKNSVHKAYYKRRLASMEGGGNTLGELGPEAVLKALVHACESRHPRPQYFVTTPTKAMSFLKRVLPKRHLDALLLRATR